MPPPSRETGAAETREGEERGERGVKEKLMNSAETPVSPAYLILDLSLADGRALGIAFSVHNGKNKRKERENYARTRAP